MAGLLYLLGPLRGPEAVEPPSPEEIAELHRRHEEFLQELERLRNPEFRVNLPGREDVNP